MFADLEQNGVLTVRPASRRRTLYQLISCRSVSRSKAVYSYKAVTGDDGVHRVVAE